MRQAPFIDEVILTVGEYTLTHNAKDLLGSEYLDRVEDQWLEQARELLEESYPNADIQIAVNPRNASEFSVELYRNGDYLESALIETIGLHAASEAWYRAIEDLLDEQG